MIWFTR